MSARESAKVSLLRGGYPEVLARPRAAPLWFPSFLQAYLERDVRAITAVQDLALFRRFLALGPHAGTQAIAPGVRALPFEDFVAGL